MITRSKDGIFQPKVLAIMTNSVEGAPSKKAPSPPKPNYTLTEPPSYKIAAQHPQWCSAMVVEFDAIHRFSLLQIEKVREKAFILQLEKRKRIKNKKKNKGKGSRRGRLCAVSVLFL